MMFQKKVVVPEIIPLTDKEIRTLKDKLTGNEGVTENLNIKDLVMSDLVPQVFNGTAVCITNNKHTLNLPYGMDMGKFKTFRKSRGGVFSNDVLQFTRGKDHGKYILIEGNNKRKIVRIVEDSEILTFKSLHLIQGIIKDKPYMLVKNLESGEKLTGVIKYIEKENSEHNTETENIEPIKEVIHDVSTAVSVSLFGE